MTLTALLMSVGVGAFGDVEGPAKATPVAIVGTVVDAGRRRPAAGAGVFFSTRGAGGGWGEVVARTETDARGRFRLEVPGAAGRRARAGHALGVSAGLAGRHALDRPARRCRPDGLSDLVLDEPARAEFLVRGPDGRPVAGARIQPRVLDRDFFSVPDGLAERIEAQTVTDDRGRAVLTAFFPEEISTVIVVAPGLGRQQFGFSRRGDEPETKTIDLMPVGRVEGRIVADASQFPRRRRLMVISG